MDRLRRDEAESHGIKIRIPPNGIRQKVSIRRGRKEKKRRERENTTIGLHESREKAEERRKREDKGKQCDERLVIRI